MDEHRSYTGRERRERARLILRTTRQAFAGPDAIDPGLCERIDRIDATATDRGTREATALYQQHETAKNNLATAKAAERAAKRADRPAARTTRRTAEGRVRDTERAIRRAGL